MIPSIDISPIASSAMMPAAKSTGDELVTLPRMDVEMARLAVLLLIRGQPVSNDSKQTLGRLDARLKVAAGSPDTDPTLAKSLRRLADEQN